MGTSSSKTSTSSSCSNSSFSASNSPPETKLNTQLRAFSFPMPSIHHPPVKKGDTHHLVSLTSTTYGSLLLVDLDASSSSSSDNKQTLPHISVKSPEPKESRDSLSPDSVINTWELMNGLDDEPANSCTGKCNGSVSKLEEEDWISLSRRHKQPLWKHMSEESFLSDLDPNIISSYKKALSSKCKNSSNNSHEFTKQRSLISLQESISLEEEQEKARSIEIEDESKNNIVLYYTSLRGIRKTYEDCCCVRAILRGFQVAVEERDISMDSKYRKELQNALGEEKPVCLPQVFIRGIRIGGIEEIKILNDGGELGEMLKEFPVCESSGACECCGDARFVPCSNCGGSTKVFEELEDGFKRCNRCNENGLVRCNKCCL
ncbi:hypothetical protein AALP_AA4G197400 [Arabis alpina]|uniref:Glutaredoxin domain-containing protein n=1 Tax=Arabis alpina TaxID=50452 RepID=A0A087H4D2_ARAAL|nr:hypothetical protein AALP_AA4G197400 [Arabis alpina]